MLIWIIDEEWKDYDYETQVLGETFPGVEIKTSTYDYQKDLDEFGYRADGILAQVYADIPAELISKLENCKVIATYGGGYDRIDIEACKEKGIMVTNIQDYCSEDLADYTIASMFHVNKKLVEYGNRIIEDVKNNRWGAMAVDRNEHRLSKQTLLIIGFGAIGKAIAKKAISLDINVIAYDEYNDAEEISKYGVKKVGWEEGLSQADFVSINLKGVDKNANKLNYEDFLLMKPSAYLINTARGKIVNEADLIRAVNNKIIAGAILDVIKNEPPSVDEPILHCENILVTPHISYISVESFQALKEFAVGNLISVLQGTPPRDPVF